MYSDGYYITYDNVHGTPCPPEVNVKYFFSDYNHPIIFTNTSNHAMPESDNNYDLWIWEYIPFLGGERKPIVYGIESRKDIDK